MYSVAHKLPTMQIINLEQICLNVSGKQREVYHIKIIYAR